MSFAGLHVGASGLAAAQRALETASHNVANANTEGYSRQRVETSTRPALDRHRGLLGPGATGQGVNIDAVGRAHDSLVSANLREAGSQQASWERRADFFERAEQVLGPLDSGTTQAATDFWNTWEQLSQDPESMTARNQVLHAAETLTTSINQAAQRVEGLVGDVGTAMASAVIEVNTLADQVAQLNNEILNSQARGDTPADLLDRRDLALQDLSRATGASVTFDSQGAARVAIGNVPLVDGTRSHPLEVVPGNPPTLQWQVDGNPVSAGGDIGSLVELASSTAGAITASLDTLAAELIDLVNTAHASGFDLDGAAGGAFFSGTDAASLGLAAGLTAGTIAASSGGAAADGNHALVMGSLRSTPTASGQTIGERLADIQGSLGVEAAHAQRQLDLASIVTDELASQRASTSGVSTDEELTDMLRFQRAYEASARVITVMDQLLDRLINGTGATR